MLTYALLLKAGEKDSQGNIYTKECLEEMAKNDKTLIFCENGQLWKKFNTNDKYLDIELERDLV